MDTSTKKSLIKLMLAMRAANGESLPPELEPHREKLARMVRIEPAQKPASDS